MKKYLSVLMTLVIGAVCFIAPMTVSAEEAPAALPDSLSEMQLVSSSEGVDLYVNFDDATFAVMTKEGTVWHSNPEGRKNDPVATGSAKNLLNAQMVLSYYNKKSQFSTMDSYNDSYSYEGITVEKAEGGVSVTYAFGRNTITRDMLPTIFYQERFEEEILPQIEDAKLRKNMQRYYKLIDKNTLSEEELKQELETYPSLKNGNLYVLSAAAPAYIVKEMYAFYESIGYTVEDLQKENAEHGVAVELKENARFEVTARYYLDGGSLVAEINCADIVAPRSFPLTEISFLPYFGAAVAQDEGYVFVPDGSGSLIYHNNGKKGYSVTLPVYGEDTAKNVESNSSVSAGVTMPVYGIRRNQAAVFCILEEGDAHASVYTQSAGTQSSYSCVNAIYTIRPFDRVSLDGTSDAVNVYQETPYQGKIKQRYCFLSGEDADYVGMAKCYQAYLVSNGTLRKQEQAGYPFLMETLGAFQKKKTFIGIPYTGTVKLTTFSQTETLVRLLAEHGVDSVDVRLNGWFNGGLNNRFVKSAKPISALGGKKSLRALEATMSNAGGRLFLDSAFQFVNEGLFSFRYNVWSLSARYTNKEIALIHPYDLSTFMRSKLYSGQYLLTPTRFSWYMERFTESVAAVSDGIPFYNDLGDALYSDYHKAKLSDRQASKQHIREALGVGKQGYGLEMGNVYALSGAGLVTGLPSTDTRYYLEDETVPFVQIVLHGYVDYAGTALNMADDYETEVLKAVETASLLYYVWSYDNAEELKDTRYQHYSTTNYVSWIDEAATLYKDLQPYMTEQRNQRITDHEILENGLRVTVYENGVKSIVNYADHDVEYDGKTVKAKGYLFEKAGETR